MENMKKKMHDLREEIKKYNDFYYSQNKSLISDTEYDMKLKELESLELKYPEFKEAGSPTESVGSSLTNTKFSKVKHDVPMISLANSYNIEDIDDFVSRVRKLTGVERPVFALEVKLDGLSISIHYKDGKLVRAVTRGDGLVGEDVTENILAIQTIPKVLNENITCEVRGEVVFPLSNFEVMNSKRRMVGEEPFANARNAASGTLRQLDPKIVAERGLDAYFYYLVDAEKYNIKTHHESIKYLAKLGLKVTGICETISNLDHLNSRITYWGQLREDLDYDTDGMVIKLDDLSLWSKLGQTNKVPRWAIAYKFPSKQVTTKLRKVTWQVGRTGKLTPVAELDEVELSGSTIKRATLHNLKLIWSKDIRIGDTVFLEKAAEIIPQVVRPVIEDRTGNEMVVSEPTHCPECRSRLTVSSDKVDIRCTNKDCPAIVEGKIIHFVSRDAMNIVGMADELISRLVREGFVEDISDLYELRNHRDSLIKLPRMGETMVDNLLKSIDDSLDRPYKNVIAALGIPNVGLYLAGFIAKASGNIDNLMRMSVVDLENIDLVGHITAESIFEFFRDPDNISVVLKLKKHGLNFVNSNTESSKSKVLSGKKILFTGTLTRFSRNEAKEMVELLGGENASSVSKSLNILVVGENPGSKVDKAKDIGTVKILTEDEFLKMCK